MDFFERMKQAVSQGVEATRKGMEVAGEKARELGEKGTLKFEIARLENDVARRLALLGGHVYRLLAEKGQSTVSKGTPEVKELLGEIGDLQVRIEEKEKALAAVGRQ